MAHSEFRTSRSISMSLKRKCLSIFDRKRIIEAVDSSKKKKDVGDSFQIPSLSLSTILKQKEAISNTTDAEGSQKKTNQVSFPVKNNFCTLSSIELGSKKFQ